MDSHLQVKQTFIRGRGLSSVDSHLRLKIPKQQLKQKQLPQQATISGLVCNLLHLKQEVIFLLIGLGKPGGGPLICGVTLIGGGD